MLPQSPGRGLCPQAAAWAQAWADKAGDDTHNPIWQLSIRRQLQQEIAVREGQHCSGASLY